MFKIDGEEIVFEGQGTTENCMICSRTDSGGVCWCCCKELFKTQTFQEVVLPKWRAKYGVGNRLGCIQTEETRRKISVGQKKRWDRIRAEKKAMTEALSGFDISDGYDDVTWGNK
jgi:hypothetical protein